MEGSPVAALVMLEMLKNLFKAEVALACVQSWSWILFLSYLPPIIQANE